MIGDSFDLNTVDEEVDAGGSFSADEKSDDGDDDVVSLDMFCWVFFTDGHLGLHVSLLVRTRPIHCTSTEDLGS